MIVSVVSTGCSPPPDAKKRCLESVARQQGVEVQHLVHDAGIETPLAHFEFLSYAIAYLPADRIVACVDLDDWLLRPDALAIVAKAHEAGAWVTYGSFRYADGRAGFAAPCDPDTCRKERWRASHLKTFRAGLFRWIPTLDLKIDGRWIPHARDLALMFPLLEMAGPKRSAFIPTALYSYNLAASSEFNGGEEFMREEARCVEHVRALPKRPRVESL